MIREEKTKKSKLITRFRMASRISAKQLNSCKETEVKATTSSQTSFDDGEKHQEKRLKELQYNERDRTDESSRNDTQ